MRLTAKLPEGTRTDTIHTTQRKASITQPGDLWRAVREMVSEIAVDRDSRRLVAAPSE